MTITLIEEPGSIVEIKWVDSMGHSHWEHRNEYLELKSLVHWTSGYLLRETEDRYVVAQSFGDEIKNVDHVMEIPKCAVQSFRVVTLKVKE